MSTDVDGDLQLGSVPVFEDRRGRLTLLPFGQVPFTVARAYVLSDLPAGAVRGGHACRTQHRYLIAVTGMARVTLDDGRRAQTLEFRGGDTAHVRPGVWHEIEALEGAPVIVVLADGVYDPGDYVSDRQLLPLADSVAAHTANA